MKKALSAVLALTLGLSLVAGCGGKPEEGKAGGKKSVTVYSPHPKQVVDDGVKRFEEATGIKVNLVTAGTGELLKRIESESSNPQCDVFWGGGADSVNNYKKFLEPYKPKESDKINTKFVDPENYWTGESPLPMVLMYNTKLVSKDQAPKSWKDVTKPEFKGKVAMADPAKSGSAFTILCTMLAAYGKDDGKGWDFINEFYKNLDNKIIPSSGGVYKGVNDGEYAVGLTLEKEAMRYVQAGGPVAIVYPEEGTTAVPDAIALVKGSKNKESAEAFIDFMLSKETQTYMYKTYNRRPVRTDIEAREGDLKLDQIKLVDYDLTYGSEHKADILDTWKKIISGQYKK